MKEKTCQVKYITVEHNGVSDEWWDTPDLESENDCGSYCDSPMEAWEIVSVVFYAPLTRIYGEDGSVYTVSKDGTMVVIT